MDVFRHVGRSELTAFAGGAPANRALEQQFWAAAPYTEADRRAQIARIASSGPRGKQALADMDAFIAGINTYLKQAYRGRYFPGEYDVTGHVNPVTNAGSIQQFKRTDLIAIGALFGSGGGAEVTSALVKQAADEKYGVVRGDAVWRAFREENDPEAVLTLHSGQRFPYAGSQAHSRGVAMPDSGSVTPQQLVFDPTGSAGDPENAERPQALRAAADTAKRLAPQRMKSVAGIFDHGVLPENLLSSKHGMSNALVVSGKYTAEGHRSPCSRPRPDTSLRNC